ncbi:retinol dehydrogenase 11 [Galendromus occidentalis]|uniref:Retinol dehydrogenase 11 n=1 Tax=Galendromus occidentalis TaxID=34638 RepID=A0AAJ6QWT1_9ACAR|nr:retinol dehydrogenase 11 [Galendromus occidentalis]
MAVDTKRFDDGVPSLWLEPLALAALLALVVCVVCKLYSRLTVGVCTSTKSMKGKTVIITGANAGIGKETARELAKRDARVIIACRNLQKASEAAKQIEAETGKQIFIRKLDLCSLKSVKDFAEEIIREEERVDVLINNAGIVPFPERVETVDGFEQTFQTNHLAPFLLTNLLLNKMKETPSSRIITLSSSLHHFGRIDPDHLDYSAYKVPMQVYSDTKLANILFTRELARRLRGTGVTANVCHPGAVQTDINSTYVGFLNFCLNCLFFFFGKTPLEGAQTSLHLSVSEEVDGISGEYWKDCRVAKGSAASRDMKLATKLWNQSEKLTGLAI